ncbi:hypothetical protein ACFLRC_03705 [Candidatus Altiarchaeota archaeon]
MDEETKGKIIGITQKLLIDGAHEDELLEELDKLNQEKRKCLSDLELILRDRGLDRLEGIEEIRTRLKKYQKK